MFNVIIQLYGGAMERKELSKTNSPKIDMILNTDGYLGAL